ncbi:MAG: hypothetical protein GY753_09325 [Gammaproteobacteria bacterium]|nr:hypothetical protein [Gammaproteobacteria bacterium]
MNMSAEQLYALIPAVYRQQDAANGLALKSLIEVIAEQGMAMENDIAGMYDDWFIETCAEWVVPYIGDLLGVRGLRDIAEGTPFSRRALVANMLGYRRRKGTAAVLEQLAFDATGWRTRAVEFFALLSATQHVNHVRHTAWRTPDLRDTNALELTDTAFDGAARSGDVRHIASGRGRYNIPHIGLFIWRLQSYRVLRGMLRDGGAPERFHIHPFGIDSPLFNPPQTESDLIQDTLEFNVPVAVRKRLLYDELEARRQALVDGSAPAYLYFDNRVNARAPQVFELFLDGVAVAPERVMICDLSLWQQPGDTHNYVRTEEDGSTINIPMPISAAVDPHLGRVVLAPAMVGSAVRISAAYGFPGDLGGGPYDRRISVAEGNRDVQWQLGVSQEHAPLADQVVATISDALDAWNLQPPGTAGMIVIMDSSSYTETLTGVHRIWIPEGSRLMIVAGDWPQRPMPDALPGTLTRFIGEVDADRRRPHILGDVDVQGSAPAGSRTPGELILNGLLIEGTLRVRSGHLGELTVAHSTVVPDGFTLRVAGSNPDLNIHLQRSICGEVDIESDIDGVNIVDSIIEAAPTAITATHTQVSVCASTVLGNVRALRFNASDSIFTGPVDVTLQQEGCVRFSSLAEGSSTPRRFRCQPDLALKETPPADADEVRARLVPSFTSTQYGDAAYVQLSQQAAPEILTGAEDGAEMGAFKFLKQAQRLDNLHSSLGNYLRFGLEAGEIFEN